jgi:hypothetical protein
VDGSGGDGLGQLQITGLSNQELLCLRIIGHESNNNTDLTVTTNYTSTGFVRAEDSTNQTSARVLGEFRIVTATGCTSDPTMTTSWDTSSVFVAIHEQGAGKRKTRSQTIVVH